MRCTKSLMLALNFRYSSRFFLHCACILLATLAYPKPGRSTKVKFALSSLGSPCSFLTPRAYSTSKKFMRRVLPGVELLLARLFWFTRVFMRLLLPTFERPRNATSLEFVGGASEMSGAEIRNFAFKNADHFLSSTWNINLTGSFLPLFTLYVPLF